MAKAIIEEFDEQISAGESVSISLSNVPINGEITFEYYSGQSLTEKRTHTFTASVASTEESDRATVHFDGSKTFTITAKTVSGIQNLVGNETVTYEDPLQAYGFRGDKSKVEVYSKNDLKINAYTLDNNITIAASEPVKEVQFPMSEMDGMTSIQAGVWFNRHVIGISEINIFLQGGGYPHHQLAIGGWGFASEINGDANVHGIQVTLIKRVSEAVVILAGPYASRMRVTCVY